MTVFRAFLVLIAKAFVADLIMTLTALAAVGLTAAAVSTQSLSPTIAPFALTTGVLAALTIGVARGDKR